MRFKNRYFLIQLCSKSTFSESSLPEQLLISIIKKLTLKMFGILAFGQIFSSFRVVYYNPECDLIILRCARDYYLTLKKVLFFVTGSEDKDFRLKIVSVCGTIKHAQTKASAFLKKDIKLKIN